MNLLVKILVMIGSSTSIGFGIWHFFVPKAWKWYSYIDGNATELIAAVRAINAFFSLSLVLFGLVNILLIYGDKSNRYSIIVMLAANFWDRDRGSYGNADRQTVFRTCYCDQSGLETIRCWQPGTSCSTNLPGWNWTSWN